MITLYEENDGTFAMFKITDNVLDKNNVMNELKNCAPINTLISHEILGDVVSSIETHSGERISYLVASEPREHHRKIHEGTSGINKLLSFQHLGVYLL